MYWSTNRGSCLSINLLFVAVLSHTISNTGNHMTIQRVSKLFRHTHANLIPGFKHFLSTSEAALLPNDPRQVFNYITTVKHTDICSWIFSHMCAWTNACCPAFAKSLTDTKRKYMFIMYKYNRNSKSPSRTRDAWYTNWKESPRRTPSSFLKKRCKPKGQGCALSWYR